MNKNIAQVFCGGILLLFCLSLPGFAETPQQMYQKGKNAFDNNNYLVAVKLLYAYQQVAGDQIDASLNSAINSAIQYCDEQILLAIRTKEDLDKYGHITEVVVESSGKADAPGTKQTHNYNKPAGSNRPKPSLPEKSSGFMVMKYDVAMKATPQVATKNQLAKQPEKAVVDEQLQEQHAELQKQYTLLQNEHNNLRSSFNELNEKYAQLFKDYSALREKCGR